MRTILMRRGIQSLALLAIATATAVHAQYSQEIVFTTAQPAPPEFNAWTFFWSMPVIDEGAKFDYVVIQPDGKEYFHYDISQRRAGDPIRSDFSQGFAGGDPSVFHSAQVVFKMRVTKGRMQFLPGTAFRFEFRKTQAVAAKANLPDCALFLESARMLDATNVQSGVLHCTADAKTGVPDIFLSDPVSGTRMNLTKGRVTESGCSQPWGPVGSPDGKALLFYQFQNKDQTTVERIWLLETEGSKLRALPKPSHFTWSFAWSPDSAAFAFPQGTNITFVDRSTLKMTQYAAYTQEDVDRVSWSPDGKWIACVGNKGTLTLVSPDGRDRKAIVCRGLDSHSFAWSPTNENMAVLVNGELSLVALDGTVVKRYGKASSVESWSSDGRYIAYATHTAGSRRLFVLRLSDGVSAELGISGDCYGGVWKPHSDLLAFWHETGLMVVGPDGKNPKRFGDSFHGSTMAPSWLAPEP